jgi:hypothetical protein
VISAEYVRERLTSNARWFESHGAGGGNLGVGALYYSVPYAIRAQRCVCLGSGGGFVPRMMVEAQRDLVGLGLLKEVDVTLIDAGDGGTSGEAPAWSDWFFENYPEVQLIKGLTDDVADQVDRINYLHVDADHSYEHAMSDLRNYGAKMVGEWAITAHDTYQANKGICQSWEAVNDYVSEFGYTFVNFPIGCGTALIMPKVGR